MTHPAARRRGVGAALIEEVATTARVHGLDRLGVSFGAEPALIRFWRRQGFVSLRVGLTREASSGEPAQMMGRGLTDGASSALARMNDDFVRCLPDLLASELRDIEPLVVAAWLHEGAAPVEPDDLAERLGWFAAGGGELAPIRPWLRPAWLAWWRQRPLASLPDMLTADSAAATDDCPDDPELAASPRVAAAVAALFQYRDEALSSQGRRERLVAARRLAAVLLAWRGDR